jgi:DNA polymerase III delta subunit
VAKQLEAGEEPIGVLMQVARSVESLLKAFYISKSGEGQGACYAAGISPWQYAKLQRYAAGFTEARLLHCLRRCLEAEELLKSSSKRDPALLVRQLIFEISRPAK